MREYLKLLEEQRVILLKITERLTTEQYNLIPSGFNNNIIWNLAHSLVITDGILYRNTPFKIPRYEFDIEKFKIGTKPDMAVSDGIIAQIRQSMLDTAGSVSKLISQGGLDYPPVSDESLRFMLFHEDMHSRKIKQLLRSV
jgi:hypothetical protein